MDLQGYINAGLNRFRQAIGQGAQQVQQATQPVAQAVSNEARQLPQQAANFGVGIAGSLYNPVANLYNTAAQQTANNQQQQGSFNPGQALGQTFNTFTSPAALSAYGEAASFAVPFGRGANFLTKSVLPGAAAAGIYSAGQPGANPQNIAQNALLGGVTAGAFHGVGKLVGQAINTGGESGLDPQDIQKFGNKADPQQISQVYQQAAQNKPVLDQLVSTTGQQTGGRMETNFKNPDTLAEKIVTKNAEDPQRNYTPQDVNDVYRARLIYPDKGTLYQGVNLFKQGVQQSGLQVAKETDFFKNPEDGYQGYHIDIKMPNGQHQEVQFHTEKSLAASLATHDFHAEYGDESMPAAAEKQKAALNHEIMDMPNPQAKAISDQIEQKNAPQMQEAQTKAAQEIQGNPEPLPWEKDNPQGQFQERGTVPTQAAIKLRAKQPIENFNPQLGVKMESETPPGQTPGAASQNPKLVAQQGRLARFGAMQPVTYRATVLARQADNILKSPQDNLNFRLAMENPSKLDEYASQSKNPTAFKQLTKDYSNFTDHIFNQLKNAKGISQQGYVEDYFTHIWDLSKPGAQQTFNDLMANIRNSSSPFSKERVFATIQEGLHAGLTLKNPKVSGDILQYAQSTGKQLGAASFNAKINELRPGGAIDSPSAYNAKGQAFRQSNVPGNQGTFIDPEIQKEMGRYDQSVFADNKYTKAFDTGNRFLKTWDLSFGGFHALKTTARVLTTDPQAIPRAVLNAVSPAARLSYQQSLVRDGVIDFASKIGVTADSIGDLNSAKPILGKLNVMESSNRALFDGLIQTYKMETVRGMMNKFDLSDPTQLQEAQKLGAQINNVYGGLNYEAIGRNKTIQQLLRFGVLASDFNEGKIRQIGTAFNPKDWSPGALYARQTLFGEAAVMGIVSYLGNYLAGNKNMTLQQLVQNAILNPNIPLPNNALFNNPKTGIQQTANLPSSDIGDIYRAITNPNQFIQARGAQLPRVADELNSGLDYYNQALVPQGQQGSLLQTPNPVQTGIQRLQAIGKQTLPIPGVQAEKYVQGRVTPVDAFINTIGGRVTNNPNNPTVQSQQAYFNGLAKTGSSLNVNDQKIFFGILHPTTKDADGNPIVDKNVLTTPDKYETLLANPKVLQAEQGFQQSQASHDPMWDLNPNQLRAFMQAEVITKNDPLSGFSGSTNYQTQTTKALFATLPQNFFTQRSAWFATLPQSTTTSANGYQAPQAPQMPQAISNFWQQYDQLPYGTGARSRALQSAEGIAALAFINQQQVFTNQQRADMGLPLLAQNSSSSNSSGSGGSGRSSGSSYQNHMARQYGNFGFINGRMIPRPRLPRVLINRGRLSYGKPKGIKGVKVASAKPIQSGKLGQVKKSNFKLTASNQSAFKLPHPIAKLSSLQTKQQAFHTV